MHDSSSGQDDPSGDDLSRLPDEVICREVVEMVTDYFEGALPPRKLAQVEEHLVLCDECLAYIEQMQATIVSLRYLRELRDRPSVEPPESVLEALRARRGGGR